MPIDTVATNARSQRFFNIEEGGARKLTGECAIKGTPKAADKAQPDGVNGARHTPAALITPYHREVLQSLARVLNQLVTGPQAEAALAGFSAAATSEGRQLRPRRA